MADIIRIVYFIHIQKKIVYNELQIQYMNSESTAFYYFESIKSILDERRVDYMLNDVERCNLQT